MDATTLLADPAAIRLECFVSEANSITLLIHSVQEFPLCPKCNSPSSSLHSHYQRTIADLPWHGVAVKLQLHTRKFRCQNELCKQKVFCERLPKVVDVYARKTVRLNAAITLLAFALGGEAGARAAKGLSLYVSGDTLLRRIRSYPLAENKTPKALGVDDWAKRKGQTYGTILVDLEKRKPIDLLTDRESETLAQWLKAHPGIEIITRDRAGAYADGSRRGAPEATQVADRFHLLKNVSEVLEKTINRNHKSLREAFNRRESSSEEVVEREKIPEANGSSEAENAQETNHIPTRSQAYHAERKAFFDLVKEMQSQGLSINQIRLQVNRHYDTVARYYRADSYQITTRAKGSKLAKPFMAYLRQRWEEGCHNAKKLYREIQEKGYRGSAVTIRRATHKWREPVPILLKTPPPKLPTPRSLVWLLLKEKEKLKDEERKLVDEVLQSSPEIKRGCELVQEFREIVKERKEEKLTAWLESARESTMAEFENFVTGIKRDESAVRAALTYEWSNGQTEGQINRLKMLKRQMYGRAKFDLLKARVLNPV